jgi:adenylate cyclase
MNFALKNSKLLLQITLISLGLLAVAAIVLLTTQRVFNRFDYQALDWYYRIALKKGRVGAPPDRIAYLTITDNTMRYFNKRSLNRADMALVNETLARFNPQAVAFDIIFLHATNPNSDKRFAASLKNLGNAYLPVAFELSHTPQAFQWEDGAAYLQLKKILQTKPIEYGDSTPFYASKALVQLDDFASMAFNTGHINAESDFDGLNRRQLMLVKLDSRYIPSLSLSMFLDYAGVSFRDVTVHWGKAITIPADKSHILKEDVQIPIDSSGMAFIPYSHLWQDGLNMDIQHFLQYAQDEYLQGNLAEFFQGRFVFVGNISQGASDIGQNSLEKNIPLIITHTAMLNGLLNNRFYRQWSLSYVLLTMVVLGFLLTLSAFPNQGWTFFTTGALIFVGLIALTWFLFIRAALFPIVTVGVFLMVDFIGLTIGIQVAAMKEQAFIRDAFAKYVPEKVVQKLIKQPEYLTLGGKEQIVTVLFSDIENFTTISEQLLPEQLVGLLNEYFSEMTAIILEHEGIIDKYLGDGIMAEFGVPLPVANHEDKAVAASLKMLRRLEDLCQKWKNNGLPTLKCRIGINTGVVIVGNMGSNRVFDYTVMGDQANIASRLEGANKFYNTAIMVSESTYQRLTPNKFLTRPLDVITMKGKTKTVKIFEVYGETAYANLDRSELLYYQTYQEGFDAFMGQNYALAVEKFNTALTLKPHDLASQQILSRINSISKSE